MANLLPRLVMYDCVDAYSENPKGVFSWYAESERALSRKADIVWVTSPRLLERQLPLNPHTYYLPAGVHFEKFANATLTEPARLSNIASPRLMFFGGIDERVDLKLLVQLARTHPEWQLVLLGVVRTDVSALQKLPNVHFLGQIAHDALPAYLQHADVLLLPYVQTVFSEYIQPAKLFECLATGKPIVACGLPFFEEYRHVLRVAGGVDEYAALVQDALNEKYDAAASEKRRACARENTWDARFQMLNEIIKDRLND